MPAPQSGRIIPALKGLAVRRSRQLHAENTGQCSSEGGSKVCSGRGLIKGELRAGGSHRGIRLAYPKELVGGAECGDWGVPVPLGERGILAQ